MKIQHSPVNDNFSVELIDEQETSRISADYQSGFGINIERFIELKYLSRYRCKETNLEFYRGIKPGDGKFYAGLMKYDWYYNPWKWEHSKVKNLLKPGDHLVEVGCGEGGFLNGIKDGGMKTTGLEINAEAVKKARENGLNVLEVDLAKFASKNENSFDWSVSFQVLEHIEDIGGFLKNSVKLLKSGGKLVISVPNNDSFIGKMYSPMNLPPHHMNRWNKDSLKKIAPLFGLELDRFEFEPLQQYHYNWYVSSILENEKKVFNKIPPILKGVVYRSTKKILERWVEKEAKNIRGHSILAVYTKK